MAERRDRNFDSEDRGMESSTIGVFRSVNEPEIEKGSHAQIAQARKKSGDGDLKSLIHSGEIWTVT